MLRIVVIVLLLANLAAFAWLRGHPQGDEAEREPQRLQRQVAPERIQVLPDLPVGVSAPASAAAAAARTASAG